MSPKPQPNLVLRTAVPEDSPACGQICYDAFSTISAAHAFPCDFPGPEAAIGVLSMMFSTPGFYCVVAEHEGRIVGSNCLDERSVISGVGPITIDPGAQNLGIGRRLMQAVMDRANEQGAAGIRLVQAAFHNRSLSLYAGLGFDIREPLACMQGRTVQRSLGGCIVRPAERADLDACNALSRQGSWVRSRHGTGASDPTGHCQSCRARRQHYRVHHELGFFRPCNGGNQSGSAVPDRVGGIVRRSGNPRAVAEQRPVPLVSVERSASRPADDVDERWTL